MENKKRTHGTQRIIGHLDMDAFFAAVEERNNPRWRGKPIVIGADPARGTGRGVVSTANYKAREFGIHSAMPIKKAWRLAEAAKQRGESETVFVGGSFGSYRRASQTVMNIIAQHVPALYRRSVDEAYFDVSFTKSYSEARQVCATIQHAIETHEKLTASVGVGPNKLVAKIASDYEKPNGLTVVEPHQVHDFLAALPIRAIPGVGPKAEQRLQRYRVRTVQDAQQLSREQLEGLMGKWGASLYRKVRGDDTSPLQERSAAKSVGKHHTFYRDVIEPTVIVPKLLEMSERVMERLRDEGFVRFRTVVTTVRFADFTTRTRAHTLSTPTDDIAVLKRTALQSLLPFFDHRENPGAQPVRLIGVRVEKLQT